MTSKHTPGPWHIGAMESGQVAIDAANGSEVTGWLDPDDARRIVACVNACAELDTEKLEHQNENGVPLWLFVSQVIEQRDQLREALSKLTYRENGRYYTAHHGDEDVTDVVASLIGGAE